MIALLLWGLSTSALASTQLKVQPIQDLHKMESRDTQLWHGGRLWEGDSRIQGVNLYSADGKKLASVAVPHFVNFVQPAPNDGVYAIGKKFVEESGWQTFVTTISAQGKRLRTYKTNAPVFTTAVTPDNGRIYFGDVPEQKLGYIESGRLVYFQPKILVPTALLKTADAIWVVEQYSISGQYTNLDRFDLLTGKMESLFPMSAVPSRFAKLLHLKGHGLIAASQVLFDQVMLINMKTKKVEATLPAPGGPRAMAQAGHCLVVASEESREIRFFDLKQGYKQIGLWDLSQEAAVAHPNALDFDDKTGHAFVRTALPSQDYQKSTNSVAAVWEPSGETWRACHAN